MRLDTQCPIARTNQRFRALTRGMHASLMSSMHALDTRIALIETVYAEMYDSEYVLSHRDHEDEAPEEPAPAN